MPSEPPSDVKFEIGHVLFINIVGYSKLLINEQSQQLETLKRIVRGTEQFRLAEAEGKLLRLPTGDGGALEGNTPVCGGFDLVNYVVVDSVPSSLAISRSAKFVGRLS